MRCSRTYIFEFENQMKRILFPLLEHLLLSLYLHSSGQNCFLHCKNIATKSLVYILGKLCRFHLEEVCFITELCRISE